ncbi:ngg1 interacting factor [Niveomyces insectorum RCEF 264]|uniref:Ngg1 interacting factor n=1 Tax=Niveomyces insectorum RCEF 264 TaxID=1081102 RepID=A0A167MMN8_9HYPO|nr:ngg1 interacting factor [Niveomyces insectorum RCEF 264]
MLPTSDKPGLNSDVPLAPRPRPQLPLRRELASPPSSSIVRLIRFLLAPPRPACSLLCTRCRVFLSAAPVSRSSPFSRHHRLSTSVLPPVQQHARQRFYRCGSPGDAKAVCYPEHQADRSWDNVGLLLENDHAVPAVESHLRHRVLLTNDLTPDVVDEAIMYNVSVVVSYHPIIFRGLKSLTKSDPQQDILMRLIKQNIAVYCPHTALDAASGGLNDWLAEQVRDTAHELGCTKSVIDVVQPLRGATAAEEAKTNTRPSPWTQKENLVGYGRRIILGDTVDVWQLIRGVAARLGGLQHVLVARPWKRQRLSDDGVLNLVDGVAVCAGSGFSVLKDVAADDRVRVVITGEMSHHEALHFAMRGVWVVCVLHSRSERLFLEQRLQGQLAQALRESPDYHCPGATVLVSERDRDPFEIWDVARPPPKRQSDNPGRFSV